MDIYAAFSHAVPETRDAYRLLQTVFHTAPAPSREQFLPIRGGETGMSNTPASFDAPSPTVEESMHLTLDADFEDAVPFVQLEHEFVGFETIKLSRLDQMIEGTLGEQVPRTAMIVMCHAEVARDALAIDPRLAGLLPCTTIVYERPDDDRIHVHHVSATKAIRDLGCAPAGAEAAVAALVERTSEYMTAVWENISANASVISAET